ncbi:hypothetical protein [Nocardioides sp. CFH 31398]|uniref:hypothetical protein n=1 Tax=Nocardioides sp. CFH 31398 TaxID=2919579 RepID=UPI001F06006F|nr:hypothetical protein [Nocardioides sp. CFH 31398]MCH1865208.1 hypothetical protein [Nocardioides sp. CFH 31398]
MSTWDGFVDDLRPAGSAPLDSPYVGLRAVHDTSLPDVDPGRAGLRVVLTGGAAQVAGPVALCERRGLALGALDTTLRDPVDPAGNARRVGAALADSPPPDGTRVHVRVPADSGPSGPSGPGLAALDELSMIEAVVALPADAPSLEPWLDAALDRELTVSLVGGTVGQAVDAVRVAARLWGDPGDVAVGRRFVVSWLTDDTAAAVAHLEGLA